jgi:hypothetical protein
VRRADAAVRSARGALRAAPDSSARLVSRSALPAAAQCAASFALCAVGGGAVRGRGAQCAVTGGAVRCEGSALRNQKERSALSGGAHCAVMGRALRTEPSAVRASSALQTARSARSLSRCAPLGWWVGPSYRQLLFSGHAVVQTHEHVQCLQSSHVRSDNAHTHTTSARSKRCRDSPRQRPNRVGIQTSKLGGPRAPSSDTPPCAAHRASITPERPHAQRVAQASRGSSLTSHHGRAQSSSLSERPHVNHK